jgi:protein-S-isoprenylcysteine O-methyltransferase Ste14
VDELLPSLGGGRENEYLEKRFGDDYRKYNARVNQLVPFPRSKHE